jgi:hypothetical protein
MTFHVLGEEREITSLKLSMTVAGDEPNSTLTLTIRPSELQVLQGPHLHLVRAELLGIIAHAQSDDEKPVSHCKDCKHFVPNDGRESNPIGSFIAAQDPPADWGWCDRADSRGGDVNDKTSLAVARDFELYEAHLSVSPDFGCIQFEQKGPQ